MASLNFELTGEHAEIRDLVRKVGTERLRPGAFERRVDFEPPEEELQLLGELGILGMSLPSEYGGADRSELEAVIAIEEIAYACPVTASFALLSLTGPASFVAKWGTDEQKGRYLPDICTGRKRFAISMTEPEAGSAMTELRTRAEPDKDDWRVTGQKIFCSDVTHADHILVFVRFAEGASGIGVVIAQTDTPGLTISPAHRHISGQPWSELFFEDAFIPAADVVSTGGAFRQLMASFSLERCGAAAFCLGVAQIAFDLTCEYVEERTQFGRRLTDFQFVQGKLADMHIALESSRLLVHRAIARSDGGLPSRLDSSAAKIAATEAACFVTDTAMQLHGGSGMSPELPIEWLHRVVRPYTIAGGTSDVLRIGIAGELVGRRLQTRRE